MYKAEFVEKELQVNIKEINYQQKEIQPTAESAQNANAAPSTTPSAKPEEKKAEPANKVEFDKKSAPVKKVEDKKPTEENKDKK